jgi:methionyl aminopeptidase
LRVIGLKSPAEIEAMRPAGRLVGQILAAIRGHARVGMRLLELDAVARDLLRDAGATSPFLGYQPRGTPRP